MRFAGLYEAILTGDNHVAVETTQQALDDGVDAQEINDEAMIPAMAEVGERFENEDYFVPELLLSARAMKAALVLLRPLLAGNKAATKGRVVIGTVKGDLHDIGKNIVVAMLEGAGYDVVDLGTDVLPEKFAATVKEANADLLGLSALLTVTMPAMKTTIDALEDAGVRDLVKVMVGGAPLSAEYARQIGADGYADNATAAVRVANELAGSEGWPRNR